MEKYECWYAAKGYSQSKAYAFRTRHQRQTLIQPSIRMALALMALADWEGRQLGFEMAYLDANVGEELYIGLPDGYRRSKNWAGRLQNAMHGLVHAELLYSKKPGAELKAKRSGRCQADPCVGRRQREGNVVVNIALCVEYPVLLSATKEHQKQALERSRTNLPHQGFGVKSRATWDATSLATGKL